MLPLPCIQVVEKDCKEEVEHPMGKATSVINSKTSDSM
jgi:hypothetical protein